MIKSKIYWISILIISMISAIELIFFVEGFQFSLVSLAFLTVISIKNIFGVTADNSDLMEKPKTSLEAKRV